MQQNFSLSSSTSMSISEDDYNHSGTGRNGAIGDHNVSQSGSKSHGRVGWRGNHNYSYSGNSIFCNASKQQIFTQTGSVLEFNLDDNIDHTPNKAKLRNVKFVDSVYNQQAISTASDDALKTISSNGSDVGFFTKLFEFFCYFLSTNNGESRLCTIVWLLIRDTNRLLAQNNKPSVGLSDWDIQKLIDTRAEIFYDEANEANIDKKSYHDLNKREQYQWKKEALRCLVTAQIIECDDMFQLLNPKSVFNKIVNAKCEDDTAIPLYDLVFSHLDIDSKAMAEKLKREEEIKANNDSNIVIYNYASAHLNINFHNDRNNNVGDSFITLACTDNVNYLKSLNENLLRAYNLYDESDDSHLFKFSGIPINNEEFGQKMYELLNGGGCGTGLAALLGINMSECGDNPVIQRFVLSKLLEYSRDRQLNESTKDIIISDITAKYTNSKQSDHSLNADVNEEYSI